MPANDRPFIAGFPWGISPSYVTWPGTAPTYRIFDPTQTTGIFDRYTPLRYQSSVDTITSTRIIPNGTRIDKFQGYRAPVPTAEETWQWVVRDGWGHRISGDYGGFDLSTRYMHGMIVGIYVLESLDYPPTQAQAWTAQARWEGLSVSNEPDLGAGHAIYTARFVRLTEWNFILGPVTIS